MMIGCVLLLVVLVVIPIECRHFERKFEKSMANEDMIDVAAEGGNSAVRRQLQRPHLRIHVRPPKVLRVQEGDDEFLECQAGGSPAPDVHWLKDGKRIQQDQSKSSNDIEGTGLDVSFTTSRLHLDCLSSDDEAEYTCVAENPFQRSSTTTRVAVQPKDVDMQCLKNLRERSPRIHLWTKTMIASQGQSTRLRCRAHGYPRPTIRWLGAKHEELSKTDADKYEVLSNGDLVIHNLKWSDMGNYICVAENVHGEAKVEAFVYPAVPDP